MEKLTLLSSLRSLRVSLLRVKSSRLWVDFVERIRMIQGENIDEWVKVLPSYLAKYDGLDDVGDPDDDDEDGWEVER